MKAEVIVAISSSIIAFIAFVVSIYEIRRSRIESKLSRLPLLKISLSTEEEGFVAFGIHNEGNGSAFIQDVRITVDDEPVEIHMLLTKVFGEGKQFESRKLAMQFPTVIRANSYVDIFKLAEIGNNASTNVQLMHEFATRVGIYITSRPLLPSDECSDINLTRLADKSNEGFKAK